MDYQYLVSRTDTTTAPKFKRASVTQGSCHTPGEVATKLQSGVWQVGAESSLGWTGPMQTGLDRAFTVQPCWKRRNSSHLSLGTLCFTGIMTRCVILQLTEGEQAWGNCTLSSPQVASRKSRVTISSQWLLYSKHRGLELLCGSDFISSQFRLSSRQIQYSVQAQDLALPLC